VTQITRDKALCTDWRTHGRWHHSNCWLLQRWSKHWSVTVHCWSLHVVRVAHQLLLLTATVYVQWIFQHTYTPHSITCCSSCCLLTEKRKQFRLITNSTASRQCGCLLHHMAFLAASKNCQITRKCGNSDLLPLIAADSACHKTSDILNCTYSCNTTIVCSDWIHVSKHLQLLSRLQMVRPTPVPDDASKICMCNTTVMFVCRYIDCVSRCPL